jgi:predicted hotdog family 3-hydroxylacyl-ACP dehydratase
MIECSETRVRARVVVKAGGPFFVPGRGLPAYVGFEMMAQAVSAYDGWRRRLLGEKPAIGFLLGCRKYSVEAEWFGAGDSLEIEATSLLHEGEMRSFECRILGVGGKAIASGVLNVYRPNDPAAFFDRSRGLRD